MSAMGRITGCLTQPPLSSYGGDHQQSKPRLQDQRRPQCISLQNSCDGTDLIIFHKSMIRYSYNLIFKNTKLESIVPLNVMELWMTIPVALCPCLLKSHKSTQGSKDVVLSWSPFAYRQHDHMRMEAKSLLHLGSSARLTLICLANIYDNLPSQIVV